MPELAVAADAYPLHYMVASL
eukprot:COSAG01_NODE_12754_length_1690_cov_3.585795_3_plen_20_part_01